jgi:hypothetical protein
VEYVSPASKNNALVWVELDDDKSMEMEKNAQEECINLWRWRKCPDMNKVSPYVLLLDNV